MEKGAKVAENVQSLRSFLPVVTSQSQITGSLVAPPVARILPLGENARETTQSSCQRRISLLLAVSQRCTVLPEMPTEAKVLPSGDNAMDWTLSRCPSKANDSMPVFTSHMRMVLPAIDASNLPSGERTRPRFPAPETR
jgi:hypothetical protein